MTFPISFFMPAYNCAKTIRESVASIYAGNFQDGDELVIVNDGSSDETAQVLAALEHEHPRLRVIHHAFNKGGGAARNTAIEHAQHDWLFCLDSDNLLAPNSIAALRAFATQRQADVVAFGEVRYFNTTPDAITHKWVYSQAQITLADMLMNHIVPPASGNYLFSRASWQQARRYPEEAGALDTWGFGLRQVASGALMLAAPNTFYWHRYGHESYWTSDMAAQERRALTALQLIIPYLALLHPADVGYLFSRLGRKGWFDHLDQRPLHLKNGERGRTGYVEPPPPKPSRQQRFRRWLRGWLPSP